MIFFAVRTGDHTSAPRAFGESMTAFANDEKDHQRGVQTKDQQTENAEKQRSAFLHSAHHAVQQLFHLRSQSMRQILVHIALAA